MATLSGTKVCRMSKIQIVAASILCVMTLTQGAPISQDRSPQDAARQDHQPTRMHDAKLEDWRSKWESNILSEARNRYCDKEMGEEIGWLISPFLTGFYYGY